MTVDEQGGHARNGYELQEAALEFTPSQRYVVEQPSEHAAQLTDTPPPDRARWFYSPHFP